MFKNAAIEQIEQFNQQLFDRLKDDYRPKVCSITLHQQQTYAFRFLNLPL